MLKIYTGRINYNGQDRLDITVKSGTKIFAPTWEMVLNYKNGTLGEKAYTEQYLQLMRLSYKQNRAEWETLLKQETVTFVCYCKSGDFCHRYILADIFTKLGAIYMGER